MKTGKKLLREWCVVAGMAALLAAPAMAQQQPTQPLTVKKLADNVYVAEGGGGNSGIIVGSNGVIIVDTKISADYGKELLEEVKKITPKPVTTAILTHSDGDHVNGLAAFPAGITIIAQENNKKEQQAAIAAGARNAPSPDHLPNKLVTKNKENVTIEGVKLELLHWAPAHTSGDLVVYLPAQKIVFTGDIIATNRPMPLIHLEKNGSSAGWITTAKGIAALDATQFVPGHGDVQTKAEIQEREQNAEQARAKIAAMVKEGKSLDEIKQAMGDQPPAPGGPNFASFTEVVYKELTQAKS